MDEQEFLKERFKSAVSSAVRAISENFDLEIKFSNNKTSKKNSLNLPDVVSLKNYPLILHFYQNLFQVLSFQKLLLPLRKLRI